MRGRRSLVEMRERVMLSGIVVVGKPTGMASVPYLENRLTLLRLNQGENILAEMHIAGNDAADLSGDQA
jgi:hypothetical protein